MLPIIRGIVRPLVVVAMTGCTAGFIAFGVSMPSEWWGAYMLALGWWFASRQTGVR